MGYIGTQVGLASELVKLFGLVTGLFLSFRFYQGLGDRVASLTFLRLEWASALAMVLIVAIAYLVATRALRLFEKVAQVSFLDPVNRVGGLLTGVFRACLVASVFLVVCQQLPSEYLHQSIETKSFSGKVLARTAPFIYDGISTVTRRFLTAVP